MTSRAVPIGENGSGACKGGAAFSAGNAVLKVDLEFVSYEGFHDATVLTQGRTKTMISCRSTSSGSRNMR